ncbi:MAG: bifunctional riboflavin kinase/FAD synthetase [candidate division Zixibacteria bacterium]|nr:bifunctional riboflavin kinase/FAD synthetase [candidate division Zixibacteria bacterium]
MTNLREKLELFAGLGVARVHVLRFNPDFSRTSAEDFIFRIVHRGLSAKWVLIGDDFRFGARRAGDLAMLQQAGKNLGFEVAVMESVTLDGVRVSSTAVRETLAAGRLSQAKRLLGRDYSISGRVVKGDRLGKKIGFPTANIRLKRNRPPVSGIFAVQAHGIGQNVLKGAASLGVRPTIKQGDKPQLEAHFFDFNRDIYGEHLRVEFLHKLREEEKYPDLETLTRQIARDVENARSFFSGLIDA